MKLSFIIPALLCCSALTLMVSCGSSSSSDPVPEPPKPNPTLTYTNPATTGVFGFVKNNALSTANRLVLDLVADGQAEESAGLAFAVTLNNTDIVNWARISGDYVQNGDVFDTEEDGVLVSRLEGNQLKVVLAHKGIDNLVDLNSGPLARVALDLRNGASTGNTSFTVNRFQIIPGTRNVVSVSTGNVSFGNLSYN